MAQVIFDGKAINHLATKIKTENDVILLDVIERLHLILLEFNVYTMQSPRFEKDIQAFSHCIQEIENQSKALDEIYAELIMFEQDNEIANK